MKNLFKHYFDVNGVKNEIEINQQLADFEKAERIIILIPNYSINIQSKYRDAEDPEQIDWDWQEFEEQIGTNIMVNDYDDLIIEIYPND
jgi:hypothetical protein